MSNLSGHGGPIFNTARMESAIFHGSFAISSHDLRLPRCLWSDGSSIIKKAPRLATVVQSVALSTSPKVYHLEYAFRRKSNDPLRLSYFPGKRVSFVSGERHTDSCNRKLQQPLYSFHHHSLGCLHQNRSRPTINSFCATHSIIVAKCRNSAMSDTRKAEAMEAVETIIQYHFKNKELLWEALQAAGASSSSTGDGNKRLAIVGDAVLKLALMEDWYPTETVKGLNHTLPRRKRKKLIPEIEQAARVLEEVVTNENLDLIGKKLGLDKYVSVPGAMRGLVIPWRTMAATMEAILGAVYFDEGMPAAKRVMETMGLVPREWMQQSEAIRATVNEL